VYAWLPHVDGVADEVPEDADARRAWLAEAWAPRFRAVAGRHREALVDRYSERGHEIEYAEAFEGSEYGAPLPEDPERLFP
jgi:hypothetical protein